MLDDISARVIAGLVGAAFFGIQGWTLLKVVDLVERVARIETKLLGGGSS